MRLEKKRIMKEDGRYLLFYHSAASASAEQQQVFTEVTGAAETVTAPTAGGQNRPAPTGPVGQEHVDV